VKNIILHVPNIDNSSTTPKTGPAHGGKWIGEYQKQKDEGRADKVLIFHNQ
jgi:hypothetical protein